MLTLYFSGTGNTKYIAGLFSYKMGAKCLSIETKGVNINFENEIKAHDTIVFCYPIYCSRVPRIMREFVHKHMDSLIGKKVIIFVTQMVFSGDGARVFTDMFEEGAINVIYAEHFNMPLNTGNTRILDPWKPTAKSVQIYIRNAETKMIRVCSDIKSGVVRRRGFAIGSKILGYVQGKPWQKDTTDIAAQRLEKKVRSDVRIRQECRLCNTCIKVCPMENLLNNEGYIQQLNNCTVCYRCVNRCPQKAITVMFHCKPKWQYNGLK